MFALPLKSLSTALSVLLLCSSLAAPAFAQETVAVSADPNFIVIPINTDSDAAHERVIVLPREDSEILTGEVQQSRMLAVKEVIVPDTVQSANSATLVEVVPAEIMVVDNDEEKLAAEEKLEFKEIADSPDKTAIEAGARFPVYMSTTTTSKTAKVGDPVEGRLKIDLKIGGKLVAPKGSLVIGHVTRVYPARKMIAAELIPNKRWMRMAGSLSFDFDEIITPAGEHLPLVAAPARQARIIKNMNEGRVLGVNHANEIASPLSTQVKHQALHLAIRAGAAAGGVFSFGIVPAAYGIMGAINPSFAFMQPVGKNMRHRRLKGFALGVVTGLPGGFLISDSIIRGPEAIVKPGDIFHAEFKQRFTGEAATSAELLPNVKTKVHGEQIKPAKK
ncbi:MAG TPA: hypothetical protein EYN91_27235 [Candidatus Melainabacteria bacterium]|nr:hypothetical protein [Candidatus Melainabacteria bacterium]HIN66276.1 hypothetical protein [Candidatus Obscuribacterales bacterium]